MVVCASLCSVGRLTMRAPTFVGVGHTYAASNEQCRAWVFLWSECSAHPAPFQKIALAEVAVQPA